MKTRRLRKGFSLIELLLAMGVVSIVMVALVGVLTKSVQNAVFAKQKVQANRYALEATDWVRSERDTDWTAFYARVVAQPGGQSEGRRGYCIADLVWTDLTVPVEANEYPCGDAILDLIPATEFTRWVVLSVSGTRQVDATIKVRWIDGRGQHESKSSVSLTDWKSQ